MTEYGRIHTDGSRSGGQPVDVNAKTLVVEDGDYKLANFVISPDPLVEVMGSIRFNGYAYDEAEALRAGLDALGLEIKIRKKGQ
jgi:hypothetical protein